MVLLDWVCQAPHAHHTQRIPQPPDDTSLTYRSEGTHVTMTLTLSGDTNGRTIRNAPPPLSLKSSVGPYSKKAQRRTGPMSPSAGGKGEGMGSDRVAVSGVSEAVGWLEAAGTRGGLHDSRHDSTDGMASPVKGTSDGDTSPDADGDGSSSGGGGGGVAGYTLASMITNDQSGGRHRGFSHQPRRLSGE